MQRTGTGRIYCWEGGSLWIGRPMGSAQIHAHHAIQLSLALSGSVRFRTLTQDWQVFDAVLVPSHLRHAFEADAELTAQIFLEPESTEGRALLARFGTRELAPLPLSEIAPYAEQIRVTFTNAADARVLELAAKRLIAALATTPSPKLPDARVNRAIRLLSGRLEKPPSLQEVATAVHLSPSRFRHLFVQQTGQSLRSYLLWLRLQRAIQILSGGESATAAAHAAGFADAAHLTRTFRRMMGIVPTSMRIE